MLITKMTAALPDGTHASSWVLDAQITPKDDFTPVEQVFIGTYVLGHFSEKFVGKKGEIWAGHGVAPDDLPPDALDILVQVGWQWNPNARAWRLEVASS